MMGGGFYPTNAAQGLAAAATFISFINVFGGFIVTGRMLDMFKRSTDPPEYNYLYGVPAAAFMASYGYAISQGYPEVHQMVREGYGKCRFTHILFFRTFFVFILILHQKENNLYYWS